ncbi:MAG: hypothetical protein JO309_10800 [Pseudonocardiales bacterium]|nr:hypothetical protein [Pseudonocardiales bacterium]MBV9729870.1 hypothetical protein [Pseudonocardiales bacterium]
MAGKGVTGFADLAIRENLVVTETDSAYWLDGDLPHVCRWQRTLAA